MTLTVDQVRQAIATLKEFAENEIADFDDAEHLAYTWWTTGDHNGHNDWDLLSTGIQDMWTAFAQAALREIETGNPTPVE